MPALMSLSRCARSTNAIRTCRSQILPLQQLLSPQACLYSQLLSSQKTSSTWSSVMAFLHEKDNENRMKIGGSGIKQSLQSSYLFTTATTSATSTAAMDHNAGFRLAILNLMAELDSVEMAGALKVGWGGVVHDFVDDF